MTTRKPVLLMLHGWGGNGNCEFFPQVKKIFSKKATIINPDMPTPLKPRVKKWIETTKDAIKNKKIDVCLCHSLGGTLAMNMISQGLLNTKCLITVGSSYGPKNDFYMDKFLKPPINLSKLKELKKFYAVASYDDPATCPEYSTLLVKQANAVGIFYNKKGHFINGTELPDEVIDIIKKNLVVK